jgi:DNA processing protein
VILTDLVVAANEWPAALLGRPGVHVASSTAEIMSFVEDITAAPKTVDDLLAAAVREPAGGCAFEDPWALQSVP